MSEQTIMKSWLIISYSQKRSFKEAGKKTKKDRTPLGDKGLGRLSTQRLADICEIFTNEEGRQGTHIGFNWKDFEKEEALSKVKVEIETFKPQKKKGTTLVLANLNNAEVWQGGNLEKFKGHVSQIISPYKESRPFDVYLKINGITVDLDKTNEELRELAISHFNFGFDGRKITIEGKTKLSKFVGNKKDEYEVFLESDNGKKFLEFLKKKQPDIKNATENFFIQFKKQFDFNKDIGGIEICDGERANPGAFSGVIEEYSYDNWLASDENLKRVFDKLSNYREFAQSQAGIKIFRNGFAIIPFGIDSDDWLKLREAQTGEKFYALRPANVIGYFSIDEGENKMLKDKTDRQGLISNPYSRNFFTLAFFIRDEINRYQRVIRQSYEDFLKVHKTENNRIKTVTQAFNQLKETKARTEEVKSEFNESTTVVKNAITETAKIVKSVKGSPMFSTDLEKQTAKKVEALLEELQRIQGVLDKLKKVIDKTEKLNEVIDILEPKIQVLEEQLANFSELASLGLTAEAISHEFSSIADRLAERSSFYADKLKAKKLAESDSYILIEYINSTVNGLKTQLKHLDPALKYNKEKKSTFKLSSFLKEEKGYYSTRFEKQGIDFQVAIDDDFSIAINRGKLIQIIDNLVNNSEYWLAKRKEEDAKFYPRITIKVESPWLYISDNGFGIAPAIETQLFEPFVTTKTKGEGRGLGLFIIQQLLDSLGCTISLDSSRNQHKRKYIFCINLSNIIK